MLVYKFGGATTRTARGAEMAAHITRNTHLHEIKRLSRHRSSEKPIPGLVVVVSAVGHTTRRLITAAELAEDGDRAAANAAVDRIYNRHIHLAESLGLTDMLYNSLRSRLDSISAQAYQLIEGIAIARELSRRTLDAILACGELMTSAVINALFTDHEIPNVELDARKFIITNSEFGNAAPHLGEITLRAKEVCTPILRSGSVILTQGFIGSTIDGITTSMGKESSDLSATLIGQALGAEEITIWKTIPGIYTADPELIPAAKPIRTLSFTEADEMGRRGVRALYPKVAKPLLETGSNAVIRVTAPASKPHHGTVISASLPQVRSPKPIALALETNIITLYVKRPQEDYLSGTAHRNETLLFATDSIPSFALTHAYYYWASDTEITLCYPRNEKRVVIRALKESGYEVEEEKPLAALSLLVRTRDAAQDLSNVRERLLRALRRFPLRAVFPVESSIVTLVDEHRAAEAMRRLHKEFFE